MPEIYVAPWVVAEVELIGSCYVAEVVGAVGGLDLRSNTLCGRIDAADPGYGLFVYPGLQNINGAVHLGSDPQAALSLQQRNALVNGLGHAVPAGNLIQVMRDAYLNPVKYDPDGAFLHKPVRTSIRTDTRLNLGPFTIIDERPNAENVASTLAVRFADYRRQRAYVDTQNEPLRSVLLEAIERETGFDMLKLYHRMGDDLLPGLIPPEYLNGVKGRDGWRMPSTTVTDAFTDTNGTALTSHNDSGGNAWVAVAGTGSDITIESNQANKNGANKFLSARTGTTLSSPDVTVQVKGIALTVPAGHAALVGVRWRKDVSATQTWYLSDLLNVDSTVTHRLFKEVATTFTELTGSPVVETFVTTALLKADHDSSDNITAVYNGATNYNGLNDTSITVGNYCGMWATTSASAANNIDADDFSAADLAVGGFAHSQSVMIG